MLDVQTEPRRGYLYAAFGGTINLSDAQASYIAVLDAAAREQQSKILLDVTRLHGDWQPAHRLAFGSFMAEVHQQRSQWPQVAILAAPPLMDPGRFTQMVANNRGVHMRASDSLQELMSWLGV